ncbi:hypothetical protein FRIGORI9N_470077 [Frigoribacterium sp. 9N]|nr:hypothetical protein FRIGORI9N_470077 [Frigoribacterium sp. 9N]
MAGCWVTRAALPHSTAKWSPRQVFSYEITTRLVGSEMCIKRQPGYTRVGGLTRHLHPAPRGFSAHTPRWSRPTP